MLVKDAMTTDPIVVRPTTTLPEIRDLMKEHNIRRVPVVRENGQLVGIISDHDVMTALPSPATTLSKWEMNTLLDQLEAKEFMTSPVYVTSPDCPLEEVARFLRDRKIGAMPVMEGDRLVGIVTESDIFRAFVDMLSGGDIPGLRFELRVERHRGILSQLAHIVNDNGGSIISMATLNEPDGKHKRVLVKEEGADAESVRAALEDADVEVLDVRERGRCAFPTVG
ncbi:MAG: CBS domain-containing protein [Chloroflexi bacterium]|nr:CBS domain-containing protein [Chloroflexota bacterium]